MPIDHSVVGRWLEERTYLVTPESIERYADAINDDDATYRKGPDSIAPPLFGIVSGWDAMLAAVGGAVSDDLIIRAVHLIQDMRFERPIRAGDSLVSRSRVAGIVGGQRGTSVVCHVVSETVSGERVGEFYAASYVRGHGGEPSTGERVPNIAAGRDGDTGVTIAQAVDADQTYRYADASGDHNLIHIDDDVARAVGLPGIVVHGMCTMAFACRAAVRELADGDVTRLRRFAGRFSSLLLPGQRIQTTFWPSANGVWTYQTDGPEAPVIKDGLVELR